MNHTLTRLTAFVILVFVSTIVQAQSNARISVPKEVWVIEEPDNMLFSVTAENQTQPTFGVRPSGSLVFSFFAFTPEIPGQGYSPAGHQIGWLKAEIGAQVVLIPLWIPKMVSPFFQAPTNPVFGFVPVPGNP